MYIYNPRSEEREEMEICDPTKWKATEGVLLQIQGQSWFYNETLHQKLKPKAKPTQTK